MHHTAYQVANIYVGIAALLPSRVILFFAAFGCISTWQQYQQQISTEELYASVRDSALPYVRHQGQGLF